MPHATRPGDVLGDRYRLVDLLTESGGGRFWRAHDRVLERHVAIHVIEADDARAPALMEAARRSATVLDPRVLRVLDADITDDVCYVVNEWGWGASLDILVTGTGALSARRAAWLVAEVADSIAVAHRAGVAHGRLNPENVLIDRAGGIRIIGLCVDAALHGVDTEETGHDVEDLAGLLYCALTTKWAGPSGSIVAAAPRLHGEVLRPRQVRAGIPRPLDCLCDEVLHPANGRHRELGDLITSARGMADFLSDFVGDDAGMPAALLASTPDVLPDEEQVVLPPVPDLRPHDDDATDDDLLAGADQRADHRADHGADHGAAHGPTPAPVVEDHPTEAGVPIFGDDDDDVSWLERRTTPAPPPPAFEAPPERPLFAPTPADGAPARRTREGHSSTDGVRRNDEYWPWDTGTGRTATGTGTALPAVDYAEPMPGRTFVRIGTILAAVVLLVIAVVVAINLGRGEGAPGEDPDASGPSGSTSARSAVLTGLLATAFDPQGDPPTENDADAPDVVDGDPATTWTTEAYNDQLGPPPGLKTGVGLSIDLGGERVLSQVVLSLVNAPTDVSLYVTDAAPTAIADLEPVARGSATGPRLSLDLDGVRGTHLVIWLTALPEQDDGRFRGTVAEVVVRGG